MGFPGGSDGKESGCNAGGPGSVPGSGRSPGEVNGYPLQYSCLGNPMDREAWWTIVNGATKRVKSNSTINTICFCNEKNNSKANHSSYQSREHQLIMLNWGNKKESE